MASELKFKIGDWVWINKQPVKILDREPDKQSYILSCGTSIGLMDLVRTAIPIEPDQAVMVVKDDCHGDAVPLNTPCMITRLSNNDECWVYYKIRYCDNKWCRNYENLMLVEAHPNCNDCARQHTCNAYKNIQIGADLPKGCLEWQAKSNNYDLIWEAMTYDTKHKYKPQVSTKEQSDRQKREAKQITRRFCACGQEIYDASLTMIDGVPSCADCRTINEEFWESIAEGKPKRDLFDSISPLADNPEAYRHGPVERYRKDMANWVERYNGNQERYPREGKTF